jgi:ATP-dependent exoDNAse (exonuclease V) beta subunit
MFGIKVYKASAGSGKTYTLTLEYIRELLTSASVDAFRRILAVTFTKEATGEMKDRILAELYGLAFDTDDSAGFKASMLKALIESGHGMTDDQLQTRSAQILQAILHDYSRLNITTIDSFFQKVLRNLARELGRNSRFNLEMNTDKALREAVHATIEKAAQNRQVLAWLTTYIEHKMEDERNWRVERDLFEFSRCVYDEFFQENERGLRRQLEADPDLLAGLSRRQYAVRSACKETFKRLMQQVNALLDRYALAMDDFGNSKYGLLFILRLGKGDMNASAGAYVERCRADASFWGKSRHPRKAEIERLSATAFMPLLEEAIQALAAYKTSRMITGNLHQLGLVWDIDREITEQNAENNRFMLSDTARFLHDMIDDSDAPFIYEKTGSEIRHVMIDEFQDTSRLQWENFRVLLSDVLANNAFSLIVGDVKQSIYRWRNGDWRILNDIDRRLPAVCKTLEYNYRSEKRIVEFNHAFVISASARLDRLYASKFASDNSEASPFASTYAEQNVCQKAQKQTEAGYVSIDFVSTRGDDDRSRSEQMPEAVFRQLQQLREAGVPPGDICILTRRNQEIRALADYLSSLKEEYPDMAEKNYLRLVSDEAFQLRSSHAVRMLIEALRLISDPSNVISEAVLNEGLPVAPTALDETRRQSLQKMPLFELISYLYRHLALEQIDGQSAYLFAFYDYLSAYLADANSGLPAFLRYWDDELKYKPVPAGPGLDGIRAMTIHKSKGLQFPTVIIPYCDWSIYPRSDRTIVWCGPQPGWYNLALLPVAYTQALSETVFASEYREETAQSWLDNLNLLYVGFTRAEQNLLLLSSYKSTLTDNDPVSAVGGLLQLAIPDLEGDWNAETLHFSTGQLSASPSRSDAPASRSQNPLKQTPPIFEIKFATHAFPDGKSLFKQSNQSREFVSTQPASPRLYGNLMHSLFEQIAHWDDIDRAVDNHIAAGLIPPSEKQEYAEKIRAAIRESGLETWFNHRYHSLQERSIILEENGEIVNKRPDRVLISDAETLVIDYKFGAAHAAHRQQIKRYMELLKKMQYPHVKGYLWYVDRRKVEEIPDAE